MGDYVFRMSKAAGLQTGRVGLYLTAIAAFLGVCGSAEAFEIKTGIEEIKINWDNSIRYNLGYRVDKPDATVNASPNNDDGNRNFDHGIVANRLDLMSELDVSYQGKYGVRFSGAGWYDQAYESHQNHSVSTSNHLGPDGQQSLGYSGYVKRYYRGPSGELLDAFAFGKFELAEIPVQLKIGRQTQYWGESLQLNAALNGIAYAQSPLDIAKGYAVPNTSAKELFRPLNSLSITAQPTSTITVMGQYFLEWEPNRYPEAGSYMGIYDFMMQSGETYILDPTSASFLTIGRDIIPRQARDWGVGARWNPEWLNGTLGFYYRNFSDKFPQLHLDTDAGVIHSVYASNIDLYGISLSKQILGVSVGAEFSYRHNMPLQSELVQVPTAGLPGRGDTAGARGDTLHALVNFLGLINKTPVFDSAQWLVEFNWSNWLKTTQGQAVFKGRDGYTDIDRISKDFVSVDVTFAPTWFQVFPGADLTLPMSFSRGLRGNSATGILQKDAGSYSVGASLDYLARHKFDLAYVDYFGKYRVDPALGLINNGDPALLKDRGTLSFTYRYTF